MAYTGSVCELYQSSKSNISELIKHTFEEGELNEESVVRKFRTTAADGKEHYNPDMMIALRYRVQWDNLYPDIWILPSVRLNVNK